ncbi:MAG: porin [Pseudomonadales bacterium]|nr:porin [Pseudomonadales bacterium]
MKRKLISIAVGAACAVTSVATLAMDGPTVYGRMDLSLETADIESAGTDAWRVTSHTSRLGFKGRADLDGTLSVIYKYETAISPDTGVVAGTTRNAFIALKCDDLGTILLGRHDSPLKQAQGKIDQFNYHAADIKNVLLGETRMMNVVEYISPKIMDDFTVKFAIAPGEGANIDGSGGVEDGIADSISFSVTYAVDDLYLAFGYDDTVVTGIPAVDGGGALAIDLIRLVAAYKMDDFKFGFLYQDGEPSVGTGDHSGLILSGSYKMDSNTFKAQFGQVETANLDRTLLAFGVDHMLGKKTDVYAELTILSADSTAPAADTDDTTIGVGVRHKF